MTKHFLRALSLSCFLLNACGGSESSPPTNDNINNAPVALPGNNQSVSTGELVVLDGSGSSDSDGDSLTFSWSMTDQPEGSTANLSTTDTETTSFTADKTGIYIISLTVSDGTDSSSPVNVQVVANLSGNSPLTSASSQITTALQETPVTITGAAVTYIKPAIGTDTPGFFVQAEQPGPAVFVSNDVATNYPSLTVGDIVDFTADTFQTINNRVEVTTISGLTRANNAYVPAALTQEVSNVTDLVSAIDGYTYELVSVNLTVTNDFTASGTDFVEAAVDTNVISSNTDLVLRIPEPVNEILGLEDTCTLTINNVPLWRMNNTVQLSVWQVSDVSNINCPATKVESASAISDTQVNVTFSRAISASSITDASTQFTFDNSLTASTASVNDNIVSITTSTQTPKVNYTLTVATSILDSQNNAIDNTNNTTVFSGYVSPSPGTDLVINEIDYDNVSTDTAEFVEIYNPTASTIDLAGYTLVLVNGNGTGEVDYETVDLSSAGSLAAGEYLVVGSSSVFNVDINFSTDTNAIQNGSPDGVRIDSIASGTVDSLAYEGTMTSTGEGNSPTAEDNGTDGNLTLCRLPDGQDTDDNNSDFVACTATPGTANSPL